MDEKINKLKFYASKGWPIFPCHWLDEQGKCSCGRSCRSPGKHPLVASGFHEASTDLEQITAWHAKFPLANWGMRTGDIGGGGSGILVVDVDQKSGGFETWEQLREENPEPIETITTSTPNDGAHYWFVFPDGHEIRSRAGVLGRGVDVRADDGYILVPPSRLKKPYKYEMNPSETELQVLPSWILSALDGDFRKQEATATARVAQGVAQGERHQVLVSLASGLHRNGFDESMITQALKLARDDRFAGGDHPVTDQEISEVVAWVMTRPEGFHLTDLGNADRFLARNRDDIRYCYDLRSWFVWSGKQWKQNDLGELMRKATETIRAIYGEAAENTDSDQRRKLAKHAMLSEARARIDNMIACAQPQVEIRVSDLDTRDMLLNVRNGVINLTSGELLPHTRGYFLTRLIDIDYDPRAECPRWLSFLEMVTAGDKELEYFLQKAIGYTLSARTDEHCLFFLFGTGNNGKSTFTETLRRLFGEYSTRVNIEAFMQNFTIGENATPYVAALAGSRFALASETEENRKWNESLIKEITGGDSLTARFLHMNPVTFRPSHKLWIFGNHAPRVSGTDLGFWRRMRVIPFKVSIPEEIQRPMGDVLAEFENEFPGILAWSVTGALMWQADRLTMSGSVREATTQYRSDQDLLQQFIDERCQMHPDFETDKNLLFTRWGEWCKESGEERNVKTKKWFTRQLTERGCSLGGHANMMIKGIKLN